MINSEMPCTPWRRTSSARVKAISKGRSRGAISISLSLGMTIRVSVNSLSLASPSSALRWRRPSSNENGLVTIAMVTAPEALATLAAIGIAPVPVPPPIPAVRKTISAPRRSAANSLVLSSAAFSPTTGNPPAPKPRVDLGPSWILFGAMLFASACASVFAEMKVTPCMPLSIMRLIAFEPPPPKPRTTILGNAVLSGT